MRSSEKPWRSRYGCLQVFSMDYFEEMIFTFSHLYSTNWSLGAPHTGQTSGQTPSDT
jgi:hypothetical protein